MDIVFHAHRAVISDDLRARAERAVQKAAARLRRTVGATVRFEEDGPTRRVEIVLHAPRHRPLVAAGEGRLFGPALSAAAARLSAQVARSDAPRVRGRRTAPGAAPGVAPGAVPSGDEGLLIVEEALADGFDHGVEAPAGNGTGPA